MEQSQKKSKFRRVLRGVYWTLSLIALLVLLWGIFIEPNRLVIRRSVVPVPGLPQEFEGIRVGIVADTHFGDSFIDKLRRDRIVKLFQREKPDMGFLLGDYIAVGGLPHYGTLKEDELVRFFSALKTPLGTYAVLGNHELWYGREKMSSLLAGSGIHVVENKVVKIKNLTLAGLQDYTVVLFDSKKVSRFLKEERPHIVLTHNGRILKYLEGSPDFTTFAADTHGGQVRIPGKYAFRHLFNNLKELAPGLSEMWGRKLFITTGAGGHRLNFRLFCPPEIAIVTLKGETAEK